MTEGKVSSKKVVILVVLTNREFRFSLLISPLLAKAIPVRGAKFLFLCASACLNNVLVQRVSVENCLISY
ncbi:hypothetical protein [Citrobacter sp. Igbk 16]|uniref:hypothetical protein n=1 Tax=Citrobacter sp. Igbk 16 TaxID=2963958 RepID=UPI002FE0308B